MSDLTESEITDRLRTSLREAVEAAKDLAVSWRRGPSYKTLREHLLLIEGCARQMAVFRADARWLTIGTHMGVCHKMSGNWLRGYYQDGVRVIYAPGHLNAMFVHLSVQLMALLVAEEQLRTMKTGTSKPIVPDYGTPERNVSHVQVLLPKPEAPKSGLILPKRLAHV